MTFSSQNVKMTQYNSQGPNRSQKNTPDEYQSQKQIQARYEAHRSSRNEQYKERLLSRDFTGWQIDDILRKLQAGANGETLPFVDSRHNLTLYARPPQHIRDLIAEVQQAIREIAPS